MPHTVHCTNCNAPLEIDPHQPILRCQYCGCDLKHTVAYRPAARPEPTMTEQQRKRVLRLVIFIIAATVLPGIILPVVICGVIGTSVVTSITGATHTLKDDIVRSTKTGQPLPPSVQGQLDEALRQANQALKQARGAVAEAETETVVPDPDAASRKKLEAYIDCVNVESARVHVSRARYFAWVDVRRGLTCKEWCMSWGIPLITVSETGCLARVPELIKAEPHLPALDGAAASLVEALQKIVPLVKEAESYFRQQDYKDDACAKGKELHGKLVAAFAAFDAPDKVLRETLAKDHGALQARRLVVLERVDPRGRAALHLRLALQARRVLDEALAFRSRRWVNGAPLHAALAEYKNHASAFQARCANAPLGGEVHRACIFGLRAIEGFRTSARELALSPRRRPPTLPGHRTLPGTIDHVILSYNSLLHYLPGIEQRPTGYDRCPARR